jgi:hypothetical protein
MILLIGCKPPSKTVRMSVTTEDNKDVVALAYLIRDYMRKTDSTTFTLSDIVKNDILGRVTKNFSSIEVADWPHVWRGGYAVYFKFSDERNKDSVKLTQYGMIPRRVKTKKKVGRNSAQPAMKFDGEIHYYYPERHYHLVEIILKEPVL